MTPRFQTEEFTIQKSMFEARVAQHLLAHLATGSGTKTFHKIKSKALLLKNRQIPNELCVGPFALGGLRTWPTGGALNLAAK